MLVSCSESSDTLSESTVKSLVKKELTRQNRMEGTAYVQVGYFECNDAQQRYQLRQLAANDLITYKCDPIKKKERVQKTRQVKRYGFFGYSYTDTERYWVDEDVTTYFVTIALTEKGQKLVVADKEMEPSDDAKDLKLDQEFDRSKFPESQVNFDEFAEPAPVAEEPVAEVAEAVDSAMVDSVAVVEEVEEQPAPKKEKPKSEYEQAKDKESFETVLLQAYKLKIVKARNILKTGDFTGVAEVVFEYTDVNAVGRILANVDEGKRFLADGLKFVYYQDKGWQVNLEN